MCVSAIKKPKACHLDPENIMLSEISQKMTKTIQSPLYVESEKEQDKQTHIEQADDFQRVGGQDGNEKKKKTIC